MPQPKCCVSIRICYASVERSVLIGHFRNIAEIDMESTQRAGGCGARPADLCHDHGPHPKREGCIGCSDRRGGQRGFRRRHEADEGSSVRSYRSYEKFYGQVHDVTMRLQVAHQYRAQEIFVSITDAGWSSLEFADDVLSSHRPEPTLSVTEEGDYLAKIRSLIDAIASDEVLSVDDRTRLVELLRKVEQALWAVKINGFLPVHEAAAATGAIVSTARPHPQQTVAARHPHDAHRHRGPAPRRRLRNCDRRVRDRHTRPVDACPRCRTGPACGHLAMAVDVAAQPLQGLTTLALSRWLPGDTLPNLRAYAWLEATPLLKNTS